MLDVTSPPAVGTHCVPAAAGCVDALSVFVIAANVSCIETVAVSAAVGVNVNVACVVSDAIVPDPDATVPDDAVITQAVPFASTEFVVAVTLVAVPTTSVGDEKLTVVGNR